MVLIGYYQLLDDSMDSLPSFGFDNSKGLESFQPLQVLQGFRPLGDKPLVVLGILWSINDLEFCIF